MILPRPSPISFAAAAYAAEFCFAAIRSIHQRDDPFLLTRTEKRVRIARNSSLVAGSLPRTHVFSPVVGSVSCRKFARMSVKRTSIIPGRQPRREQICSFMSSNVEFEMPSDLPTNERNLMTSEGSQLKTEFSPKNIPVIHMKWRSFMMATTLARESCASCAPSETTVATRTLPMRLRGFPSGPFALRIASGIRLSDLICVIPVSPTAELGPVRWNAADPTAGTRSFGFVRFPPSSASGRARPMSNWVRAKSLAILTLAVSEIARNSPSCGSSSSPASLILPSSVTYFRFRRPAASRAALMRPRTYDLSGTDEAELPTKSSARLGSRRPEIKSWANLTRPRSGFMR